MNIQDHIRTIPDFPKPGINFYDIATLLANPSAWRETIARLHRLTEDYQPDLLMGIESRGFWWPRRWPMRWAVVLAWYASTASYRAKRWRMVTRLNMAKIL